MPRVTYVTHDGERHEVEVSVGTSVMQGAMDNFIDGIVAECGGSCACATCHCYVDPDWMELVGPAGDIERDLLEMVEHPQESSRLSCQIDVSEDMDGLVVQLPESQG